MKTRRLSLVLMLVLLAALLVVAPVQAGRKVASFTFHCNGSVVWSWRDTGSATHFLIVIAGPTVDGDARVTGNLTWNLLATGVWPNPHNANSMPGTVWGPGTGNWRLVTPDGLSGWEGTVGTQPQTDPAKWQDANVWRAKGNGFGVYKNMRIEWAVFPLPDPAVVSDWVFEGQITEK